VGSGGLVIFASNGVNNRRALEVVFEPFEEVKKELLLVPTEASDSLARQKYTEECVAAINEQIKWVCIINLKVFNFKKNLCHLHAY
jgi:ferritin heavy chain